MANGGELVAELKEYERQIEQVREDAADLIRGLSDAQFNWSPGPNRWSVAQCLEHLNVSARLYWPVLAEAVTRSRASGLMSPGPFKHGWIGKILVYVAEPPVRRRFTAPKRFRPLSNLPLNQVWPQFLTFQGRLLELLREANGVDLARTKVPFPASDMIQLTLGHGFALVAAHERRHLWQAQQVKEDPNFPR
jgi:DinB superfamily